MEATVSKRHIVFVAEGGNRKRAAVAEAEQALAAGDDVTLVIRHRSQWDSQAGIPAGARVIDLHGLEKQERWVPVEWLLLVRGPRFAFRILGVGPLKAFSERASRAWRHRIANPLHARVFLPLVRRREQSRPVALLERGLGGRTRVDLLVVTDPMSMPSAVEFLDRHPATRVAYDVEHATMGER
jgi:hypothetical protein